jgi:DNA-binding response OmpR family regulator
LETFMREPQRVFSKDDLIDRVWGYDSEVSQNCVETFVRYLRIKLNAAENDDPLIATLRGAGYTLRS